MAQCGACSVLLDGAEIRSCVTAVSDAVGKKITTIEGLPEIWAEQKGLNAGEAANTLHPVQQAWIDEQVPQCGYCQSGMMIVAVELLARTRIRRWRRLRTLSRTSRPLPTYADAEPTWQLSMPCSAPPKP